MTDFGIARFSRNELRATSATDKAIGSVHYISPEQARGDITDEKADIYSTGVMLYEMLTGRLPFEADSAVSVAIMQLQSEPKMPREINPEIPEGLEEITMKAMQKDPAKRYQSAAEMLYDIDEFKRNPSIHFAYKYIHVDETPTKFVEAITRVKGEEPGGELAEAAPDELAEEEETEEEKKGPAGSADPRGHCRSLRRGRPHLCRHRLFLPVRQRRRRGGHHRREFCRQDPRRNREQCGVCPAVRLCV